VRNRMWIRAGDYSDEILSIARRHDSMIWDDCLREGWIPAEPWMIWMEEKRQRSEVRGRKIKSRTSDDGVHY